jgi:hypothetical protein
MVGLNEAWALKRGLNEASVSILTAIFFAGGALRENSANATDRMTAHILYAVALREFALRAPPSQKARQSKRGGV